MWYQGVSYVVKNLLPLQPLSMKAPRKVGARCVEKLVMGDQCG